MVYREIQEFNEDWHFAKLTQAGGLPLLSIERPEFDDEGWEVVTLPHTWNAMDGAKGRTGLLEGGEHYYRGLGGYRKKYVFAGEYYGGKRIFLEFEGANTVTELFVNGQSAGRHEGGFAAFRFDITELVRLDEQNVLAVKVNNAPTVYIPPITDQGDFTKMGGIYRKVKLIAVSPVHIDLMDHGASGIYITPKNITEASADLQMLIKLANDSGRAEAVTVSVTVMAQDGATVASGQKDLILEAGDKAAHCLTMPLKNPILWSGRENPYLYLAKVALSVNGEVCDQALQSFGIRTYGIDPEEGFFLNGRHLKLRGVNYHQDSFEDGWAMTDAQRERDYKMMLDMGCTSVRMAHYQHAPYEYELCDRLGLTVWTEIGIINKMSADATESPKLAEGFAGNAGQQLRELIRQNYNHPSVILWGISNELHQMTDEIYALYTELQALAKAEDPTRLTGFADNQFFGRFLTLPGDAVGYNRYFGWYEDAGLSQEIAFPRTLTTFISPFGIPSP